MKLRGSVEGRAFIREIALLNFCLYWSSTKWAGGRTLNVLGVGGRTKSTMFVALGGQQFRPWALDGKSAAPHAVGLGVCTGAANEAGPPPSVVAAPYRPPSPMSIFLLSNILLLLSWFVLGFWSSFLATLHEIFRVGRRARRLEMESWDVLGIRWVDISAAEMLVLVLLVVGEKYREAILAMRW